jgi:hypothetical protein
VTRIVAMLTHAYLRVLTASPIGNAIKDALWKYCHRGQIAGRHSRRHRTEIDRDQKHDRKKRIAKQDRHIIASDYGLSGLKPGLLRNFHCRISNVASAISRLKDIF